MAETVRLNNDNRGLIRQRAIDAAFKARGEAFKKAEDRMGRKFYNKVFSLKERKHLEALPDHWFEWTVKPYFNVGGMKMGFYLIVPEGERGLRVPSKCGYYHNPCGSIADPDDAAAAVAHFDAVKALTTERERADATLREMLARIPTVKALRATWPEGEEFYKDISPVTPVLPMVMIKDLNAMLGLAA